MSPPQGHVSSALLLTLFAASAVYYVRDMQTSPSTTPVSATDAVENGAPVTKGPVMDAPDIAAGEFQNTEVPATFTNGGDMDVRIEYCAS